MKALFIVTGRGMGGDAVTAINIARALEKQGLESEFALDHTAPGLLFKKKGLNWHKISIPQAGGHAATKTKLAKAAIKTSKAAWEASRLCRKINPQVVVGVIGGGAVVGCLAAKLTNTPGVGILITPADAKVCTKMATSIALPESNLFHMKLDNPNIYKAYSPVSPDIIKGDREKALEMMPPEFDEKRTTILFSSGSSLFKKMAQGAVELARSGLKANILVVGAPLKEEYVEILDEENIINLGYINWIQDLYKLVDIAVVTDDGMMIHESIALKIPVIALLGVKWGRYHNLASVFEGAVLESELENIKDTTVSALDNLEDMKKQASKYSADVLDSGDRIARIIKAQIRDPGTNKS
jgi:UDP-N-acetylglucosamine--N-acetylmuramyl-(pentapeptide) pyrophosphoryl-undecaprenol N-acetylglucosamine transferase